MAEKFDAIVIGAGIAGLGVAGLLQKAGMKTLCLEKDDRAGGRMQGYDLEGGWRLDIGFHQVELGESSSAAELVRAMGREVEWANWVESGELYYDGKWHAAVDMLLNAPPEQIEELQGAMKRLYKVSDEEIVANDLSSWGDWLDANGISGITRELLENNGMIMTTVPEVYEMSAGEILYISRDNLARQKNVLTAAYPKGGMLGVIDPLREAFEEAGGTLMLGTQADSVQFDGRQVKGVAVKKKSLSPYTGWFYMDDLELFEAPVVVCALPLWNLDAVLDVNPDTSVLPDWWTARFEELKFETTGLIGYTVALSEPVYDKPNVLSSIRMPHTGRPFQGMVPSAFDPGVAPEGKSLLQTDCVVEPDEILDKFELERLLEAMWKDLQEMFPGIDDKVEWKFAYKCMGCDGLSRKPGTVGTFKPELVAPGVKGLYFAGDCYRGRGLALNSAAQSGMRCAEKVLETFGP